MAFKGESYIPLIVRVKPAEGDIWRVRDNGMLFGIPLKGGDFIEWTGSAWQLKPDLHYKLDDGSIKGVQDEAIALEFEPLDESSYAEGTKRMYNGLLYIRNNTEGDDTSWVAAHWTQTNVMVQIPNPIYGMPLVKGVNGIVTNNGRSLVVTGTNAWAEGNGTVNQVQCTTSVTDANVVPLSSVARIQLGMIFEAVGGYEHPGDCHIIAIDGANNTVTVDQLVSIAEGTVVTIKAGATGLVAHSEGLGNSAEGDYSHAEGKYTIARGQYSHAEGAQTIATDEASHAGGLESVAAGRAAFATGQACVAAGANSFAAGYYTFALGHKSIALGNTNNLAQDTYTVQSVEYDENEDVYVLTLDGSVPSDWVQHDINLAWIDNQHRVWAEPVEGDSYKIVVDLDDFPDGTTADDFVGMHVQLPISGALHAYDVAIGQRAVASGGTATALGYQAAALEAQATALHGGTATRMNSLAIGYGSKASGAGAMVMGYGLNMQFGEGLALGRWNSDDNVPFVIGGGASAGDRADIFKIDSTNHVWIKNSQGTLVDLTAALVAANIIG